METQFFVHFWGHMYRIHAANLQQAIIRGKQEAALRKTLVVVHTQSFPDQPKMACVLEPNEDGTVTTWRLIKAESEDEGVEHEPITRRQ